MAKPAKFSDLQSTISPASLNTIRIIGARQHNLKNLNLELPRDRLIVFTGVSGSGKSSLAFDTIFAEGQRRYVESLSAYARQFLGQLDKPDVDAIEGLSPAISIDQKSTSHNPRSTVGTVTEIYDYLRLLFGRAGSPHCPICDRHIAPQTIDQMCDQVMALPEGTKFLILAPVVRGKKGTHRKLLSSLASSGFVRVKIDGEILELSDHIDLDKNHVHDIEIVIDRLIVKPGLQERLVDSLTTCLRHGEGVAIIQILDNLSISPEEQFPKPQQLVFSENFACPEHGAVMEELSPRLFSFNSPYGACPACHGLGHWRTFSPELIIPDPSQPVYNAIAPWSDKDNSFYLSLLHSVAQAFDFEISTPWKKLTPEQQHIILYGSDEPILIETDSRYRENRSYYRPYLGAIPMLLRQYEETGSEAQKQKLAPYLVDQPCEVCHGKRLKPEALSVYLGQYNIADLTEVSIRDCLDKINQLQLSDRQAQIGDLVLREIKARLQFLIDVGLDYLTLARSASTLSGGEAQRIRLATQIGAGLTGVLYVLDEPSIGLHQRDNGRLLNTLIKLRDLGNTLIVVEHDEETIRAADWLVDIGPGAGVNGGEIVAQGDLKTLLTTQKSLTGAYLSGRKKIETPPSRRPGNGRSLFLKNAHCNNLQNIDVELPLGKLVCITGVSGSGKSTLINELLYPALQHHFYGKIAFPKKLDKIQGLDALDKVIVIDQSPIGRTPRSNPATYTGVFDIIRGLFAETIEAKARGYKPGQFSFNVKGGRCEACGGQGVNVIEMNFLPDVYVQCEVCKGARYNRETLQVKYKGYSIADVLNMTADEALKVFENIPRATTRLQTLVDVGLGYIQLGQPAPTLSGGEAQRVKLASELSKRATGKTLYLIDEPTTGLSFYDVHQLLNVLQRLVDKGNSIMVIEHNLDVIRCADWVVDLGPEGGDRGGQIVATGTPEDIANNPHSYTGFYLKQLLTTS
ncbi:MAG: excinuclease ABC subunit UvrA [Limnospira sp. PMC 1291.21]|uniref:excinuclease ABC subunit UvrA n=1 Tax=Limnospira TaxID=2596745 RepID=UPI001448A5AF|nr:MULTISPECIES: excinuclease ABC subunit UvrA [unclassified Limnospira]QJB28251.1 excinuclease ABC subunit UvrA [Limnospira fusiformis SAG 85.79]MDT9177212.1 excinuclease ABC subunit UvrA [Limnospira sp. PMC 1238.20]MDT9192437.1 excinuclease ABC subunit UvrA [Limnospira sp. PMC 1245.20]MDT9202628.1 excinuclease ABC subunit UvrA [Limnospira sp. PMC 1243.20]MDT9207955.1 excinuclease ABC subunit UvrA [Limnospira sp. PMC 1252.20]